MPVTPRKPIVVKPVPIKGYTTHIGAIVDPHLARRKTIQFEPTKSEGLSTTHKPGIKPVNIEKTESINTEEPNVTSIQHEGVRINTVLHQNSPTQNSNALRGLEITKDWLTGIRKVVPEHLVKRLKLITVNAYDNKEDDRTRTICGFCKPGGHHFEIFRVHLGEDAMKGTLSHELAHIIGLEIVSVTAHPFEWEDFVKKTGWTSSYAESSSARGMTNGLREDFADSFKDFVHDPERLKDKHPEKFEYFQRLMQSKPEPTHSHPFHPDPDMMFSDINVLKQIHHTRTHHLAQKAFRGR